MGGFLPLPLVMQDGRPLPHTFYEGDGGGLLVVLPGLHYGPDGPVLYHLAKQLQGSGWDTLGLTYGFQAAMAFPWTDHAGETLAECGAALGQVLGRRAYSRVGIVGKSLGTILLVQLCTQGLVPDSARVAHLDPARAVVHPGPRARLGPGGTPHTAVREPGFRCSVHRDQATGLHRHRHARQFLRRDRPAECDRKTPGLSPHSGRGRPWAGRDR
ncbi:MAG: hypothetical protein HW404_2356 [Anaerolineales bacterium]|nr:hypothetical protein [Anaerolineales bacterium]